MRRSRTIRRLRSGALLGAALMIVAALVVEPEPDPVAGDDSSTTDAGTPVTIDVLANDEATEGLELDPSSVSVTSGPSNGSTEVDPSNGQVTYTPDAGFSGTDSFTYQVCEAGLPDSEPAVLACATGTVTVEVAAADTEDPPADTEDPPADDDDSSEADGPPATTGDTALGGSGGSGGSDATAAAPAEPLPHTGAANVTLAIAGLILVGGGLLCRHLARRWPTVTTG